MFSLQCHMHADGEKSQDVTLTASAHGLVIHDAQQQLLHQFPVQDLLRAVVSPAGDVFSVTVKSSTSLYNFHTPQAKKGQHMVQAIIEHASAGSKGLNPMRVEVKVRAARGLLNKDFFGLSDPYAVVKLDGQKMLTAVSPNNLNPKWMTNIQFASYSGHKQDVEVEIWDKDRFSDDFMGCVRVHLKGVSEGVAQEEWHTLHMRDFKTERVEGEILLSVSYISIETLKHVADGLYAELLSLSQHGKELLKKLALEENEETEKKLAVPLGAYGVPDAEAFEPCAVVKVGDEIKAPNINVGKISIHVVGASDLVIDKKTSKTTFSVLTYVNDHEFETVKIPAAPAVSWDARAQFAFDNPMQGIQFELNAGDAPLAVARMSFARLFQHGPHEVEAHLKLENVANGHPAGVLHVKMCLLTLTELQRYIFDLRQQAEIMKAFVASLDQQGDAMSKFFPQFTH
eukprot:TRINITY_DN5993_c0_g1_i1.p1 TRINITY_DN5993_c0_g1~~TRINITY_DN5993_c0_g1_i1.p1  ORF type:complete len:469 (+),score=111.76 TRINITY_DN5993_c0_g1_i1:40-1407(+)